MSRRAWFSAFGRPFFFPSVLSLARLPGSKQSGAWLGTDGPPRATGNPAAQDTPSLGGCTPRGLPPPRSLVRPGVSLATLTAKAQQIGHGQPRTRIQGPWLRPPWEGSQPRWPTWPPGAGRAGRRSPHSAG